MKESDPYVQCSSYHWALVKHSRDVRDLDRMWAHLELLNELAGKMARERKISRDGAHAILRRQAEAVTSATDAGRWAMSGSGASACALLSRRKEP